jgi:hypothetical protein
MLYKARVLADQARPPARAGSTSCTCSSTPCWLGAAVLPGRCPRATASPALVPAIRNRSDLSRLRSGPGPAGRQLRASQGEPPAGVTSSTRQPRPARRSSRAIWLILSARANRPAAASRIPRVAAVRRTHTAGLRIPHARSYASQPTPRPDLYEFILGSSPTIVRRAADHFAGLTSW